MAIVSVDFPPFHPPACEMDVFGSAAHLVFCPYIDDFGLNSKRLQSARWNSKATHAHANHIVQYRTISETIQIMIGIQSAWNTQIEQIQFSHNMGDEWKKEQHTHTHTYCIWSFFSPSFIEFWIVCYGNENKLTTSRRQQRRGSIHRTAFVEKKRLPRSILQSNIKRKLKANNPIW